MVLEGGAALFEFGHSLAKFSQAGLVLFYNVHPVNKHILRNANIA